MRRATAGLSTFLNDATKLAVAQVDLYTFVLSDGTYLRYSGGGSALSMLAAAFPGSPHNAGGPTTFALGPRFGRSKITTKIGVQPAELDIDVIAGANDLGGNFAFADAVRLGIFDGAEVELDRLFSPATANAQIDTTSLGCLVWFVGRVAETDVGRSKIALKVKSLMNLLALQQMPRRLYGAGCTHIFGDAMCGYNRVAGLNAIGGSGPGQVTIAATTTWQDGVIAASAIPAGYIEGTIKGLAGANAGQIRTIGNVGGDTVYLFKPFLFPVVIGDTFNILPGCDHTTSTCNGTFGNLLRFGGFPYIPPPEFAV